MPGPEPPGREAQATNGRPGAPGTKPGAVRKAFSGGEATSAGANPAPPSRTEASTWPLVSDVGARRTQLTIAWSPLLAAPTAVAASPGADSACGAPKRPFVPMIDALTRRPAPPGVPCEAGSLPSQASSAPRL